jgi:hypothetical protein
VDTCAIKAGDLKSSGGFEYWKIGITP